MELVKGTVVKSVAGHDKGDFQVVIGFEKNNVLVCDGKRRRLDSPKMKNTKHLQITKTILDRNSLLSDAAIKRALRGYIEGSD